MSRRPGTSGRPARVAMAIWLLAVWVLLWGRADAAVLAGGLAAVAVTYVTVRFPAVPVRTRARARPAAAAAGEFVRDLVVASAVIGWRALWRPRRVRGALIRVCVRSESDLVLALVTDSLTLRPGTLVLDVDRDSSVFLIHAMPVRDARAAAEIRRGVHTTERRLIRAFGTPADVERLDAAPPVEEP